MKKNKHFTFVAMAAAVLAASCTSDDIAEQKQSQTGSQTVTLTASVNEGQTRVGMTKDGANAKFYWHKGDKIFVQTKSDDNSYSGMEFTTSATTGETTASFTGTVTSGSTLGTYAVYPYSASHQFTSETELTYNLPATYTYNKVESNIFSKTAESSTAYPENSTNIPLVGKIADGKIAFKHIGGLAVIRIDKMPETSGTLTITADQQLSGNFTIADLSVDEPKITTTSESVSDDNKKVTFTFGGATANETGVFYLPLPTGSYSGVKIEVTCNENTQTINYGYLYVERNSVTAIPLYTIDNKLSKFSSIDGNIYTLNGRKLVDLGLSVLWAETNVGADTETGYGNYYAWGETVTKDQYSWETYRHGTSGSNLTKYNETDSKTDLDKEDDAAYVNWGYSFRMPTKTEFDELRSSCTWEWTTINSVNGYKVTSNKTGYTNNSIFLPASGYRNGISEYSQGIIGYYWSCTRSSYGTYNLSFNNSNIGCSSGENLYQGYTVRPVAEKP